MQEQAPEHPVLRHVANGLSIARLGYGFYQAAHLRSTPPEERTWRDTGRVSAAAATDFLDGLSARQWGSTEAGGGLDRLGDVALFALSGLSLVLNGEIGKIHSLIDLSRELSVNGMRRYAIAKGYDPIQVGWRGRQKTAIKFLAGAVADSPLATGGNLVESLYSFGSALSIISAGEYGNEFWKRVRGIKDKPKEPTGTSQNGGLRKAVKPGSTAFARWIDEKHSWITPNMITWASEGGVAVSDSLAVLFPSWGFLIAAAGFTPFSLGDKVDGDLARAKGMESKQGMLHDALGDRRQEIMTAAALSIIATNRGNSVAARQFAVAAATASLTALARAKAEMNGDTVNEDAVGTRVTRAIEGGIGIGFNGSRDISNVVSALMVSGNLITFSHRMDVVRKGSNSPHHKEHIDDPEFIDNAKLKYKALRRMAVKGALVGAGLIVHDVVRSKIRSLSPAKTLSKK